MSVNGRFVCYKPNATAKVNLICFPFAGGSASVFYPWAARLPAHIQLLAYQPPGRAQRMAEPACMSIQDYMDDIWQDMKSITDKPFILFGHSMGALLAYEVIKKLDVHKICMPVKAVFSAAKSPWKNNRAKLISHLRDNDFINELKIKGGFPEQILNNKELMELCTPYIKSDYSIVEDYCSEKKYKLSVSSIVLSGMDDEISDNELAEWGDVFSQVPEIHSFPGGHFFINNDNVLDDIISLITKQPCE
ncbi:thioesterase II family protein [Photobacterium arenosum]|uniref:thioesterase II family protein n=1 Tax=Photobacterium arenosum TaxID=2774143 RepID=UPI00288B1898|nr:alpha/beta fold hydrolase [Photobacterium arenosum]